MKKLMILIPLLAGAGLEPTHSWVGFNKTKSEYKQDHRYCKGKVRSERGSDVWDPEHIDFLVYKVCMEMEGYLLDRSENDRSYSDTADNSDI